MRRDDAYPLTIGELCGQDSCRRGSAVSAGGSAGGRHRRPGAAQAAAGAVPSGQCRLHSGLPHHRRVARQPGRRRLSPCDARRARRVLGAQGQRQRLGGVFADPRLRAALRRSGGAKDRGGESGARHRRRKPPAALPERAAERGAVGSASARRSGAGGAFARHHGKAVRHRPGQRGVAQHALA